MDKNNFQKATFLYDIAVSHEKAQENPDDVSLSIQNMLSDIRELGYSEFNYLADIELRNIKDPRIMKVLIKYYEDMDLFTRDSLMYKIHPKYFPEIISIAKKEFLNLRPSDKRNLNGFQTAMSRGKITNSYLDEMFELLENGEQYASLSIVRKKLCKSSPERMLPLIERYSKGVLVLCAIQDCAYLESVGDVIRILENWVNVTDDDIKRIRLSENNQELTVTTYEYYRDLCTKERIISEVKKTLKRKHG